LEIGINWAIVFISFAIAFVLFYLYLWILALIRKNNAQAKVKIYDKRLERIVDVLKDKKRENKK
jgi:hypothetical protein